jgi:hypothetical protein
MRCNFGTDREYCRVGHGLLAVEYRVLRVGKLAGNGPTLWLNMQQAHNLWHAERKLGAELARIQPCI